MTNKEQMKERMRQYLDSLKEGLGEDNGAFSQMHLLSISNMMAFQRFFLQIYQENLKFNSANLNQNLHEEYVRKITKAFMVSSVEFMQQFSHNQQRWIDLQSAFIGEYLECVSEVINDINREFGQDNADQEQGATDEP